MYLISVDGGGSKTELCVMNRADGACRHFLFGSTNYKVLAADAARAALLDGMAMALREAGVALDQVRGLVMGMSGVDSREDHARYLEMALATGVPRDRIYICNDSELAFYAKGAPPGLCIVAGTGSISTGIAADGRKARSGGWGTPIGDEGSGVWIGIQVLSALLRFCDGYGSHEAVFDSLLEASGAASFQELPPRYSPVTVQETAAVAKLVMDWADAGDAYCAGLVHKAARLVSEIARSVYAKLDFGKEPSVDVVMSGSLFKSPCFQDCFARDLRATIPRNNLRFCQEVQSPVLGGIVLAQTLFGQGDVPGNAPCDK